MKKLIHFGKKNKNYMFQFSLTLLSKIPCKLWHLEIVFDEHLALKNSAELPSGASNALMLQD